MASESSKSDVRAEFQQLDKRSNLLRLASMMRPYSKKMLLAMLFVIVINLCELLKPLAAKIVIDDFVHGGRVQHGLYSIAGLGIAYFLLSALDSVCKSI